MDGCVAVGEFKGMLVLTWVGGREADWGVGLVEWGQCDCVVREE